jgi:hypothetical protein
VVDPHLTRAWGETQKSEEPKDMTEEKMPIPNLMQPDSPAANVSAFPV